MLDDLIKEAATRRDVFKKLGATALGAALLADAGFDPDYEADRVMAAGEAKSSSVRAGVAYLLRAQQDDGLWRDPLYTGTGFPRSRDVCECCRPS